MYRPLSLVLLLTTITSACGDDGPTDLPPTPEPVLELAEDTITLSALEETATIAATLDGAPVGVSLSVVSEVRWNQGLDVVITDGATVTATGAGTVALRATASGQSDTVIVNVEPASPYLSGYVAPEGSVSADDPLVIEGWGLDGLDAGMWTIGGATPAVTVLDSARIALSVPPLPAGQCVGGAASFGVDRSMVTVLIDVGEMPTLALERPEELSIAVGEMVRLTTGDVECLMLSTGEYTLAFYDTRFMAEALQPRTKSGTFTVSFSDVTVPPSPWQGLVEHGGTSSLTVWEEHLASYSAPRTEEWQNDPTPWVAGDTIPDMADDFSEISGRVKVLAVVDGFWAVAQDTDQPVPQTTVDSVVALLEGFQSDHAPWYRDVFGVDPAGNNANGMIPVVVFPASNQHHLSGRAGPFGTTCRWRGS
jgi:predicted small lipoprotein YifL